MGAAAARQADDARHRAAEQEVRSAQSAWLRLGPLATDSRKPLQERFDRGLTAVLDPELREHVLAGDAVLGQRHPGVTLPVEFHRQALLAAGFAEAGEVWRYHRDAVLAAEPAQALN